MKVSADRSALLKALAHAQSVVEKRTTIPILSHVLLEAEGDLLRLTSTDLELAIVESVPAQVEKIGSTTVPAHMLHDIVRKLPDGAAITMTLDPNTKRLTLSAGRSRFQLSCLPVEEFPAIQAVDMVHKFRVSAKEMLRLIDRTRFAMSTEETRYNLNGIFFHAAEGSELRAVATDGHRLARASMPLPQEAASMPGVILSRKAVGEMTKILSVTEGDVLVGFSDTQMSLTFEGGYLTSRLIDGTFPEYERVIPAGNDKVLRVDIKSFSDAVDRVATISAEKTRGVKVALSNGKIILTAASAETGMASEEMEVDYQASELEVGFNSRYLLDIAQQIGSGGAEFAFADPVSPVLIRDDADASALYVLMPMRV
ncbi:MAG: DNA polymerase III subunit beta [Holosporales bacterium]